MIRIPNPTHFPPELLQYLQLKNDPVVMPFYATVVAEQLLKKVPFQDRFIVPSLLEIVLKSNFGRLIR